MSCTRNFVTLAFLLGISAGASANCAYGGSWPDHCNPPPTATSSSTPGQPLSIQQEQQAAASAESGSTASSQARARSESTGGGATLNGGNSEYKALAVGLPQPVNTTIPPAIGCIVSESTAHALGWNFWSKSSSEQRALAECVIPLQIVDLRQNCQFDAANRLQAAFLSKLSGVTIELASDQNLPSTFCLTFRDPPPVKVEYVDREVVKYVEVPATCKQEPPIKPHKPAARKPCTTCCK